MKNCFKIVALLLVMFLDRTTTFAQGQSHFFEIYFGELFDHDTVSVLINDQMVFNKNVLTTSSMTGNAYLSAQINLVNGRVFFVDLEKNETTALKNGDGHHTDVKIILNGQTNNFDFGVKDGPYFVFYKSGDRVKYYESDVRPQFE